MDLEQIVPRMQYNAAAIAELVADVGDAQARWRPAPGDWSILEVVNHLFDEEREDFRMRLDLTLHHPDRAWPPTDPPGWVIERDYNSRDLAESLANFMDERRQSLVWLAGLDAPDWDRAHDHPNFGPIPARDLMASWLVHDLLHLRQLVELHYLYAVEDLQPASVRYAGEW